MAHLFCNCKFVPLNIPHLFLFFAKCALRTFKYQKEIIYIYVKIKRSSHSPVVFKHGCSLKTYLDHLETKIEIPRYLYFSKNNADMHLILKSGMEWGGRREEGSGWGTHVYLWRIHFDIWQI